MIEMSFEHFIIQYLDIHLCAPVQIISHFPFYPRCDLKKTSLQMDTIKQMHFFMQIKKTMHAFVSCPFP